MNSPQELSEVIAIFETFSEPEQRSMLLIDYAEKFESVPERIAKRPFPTENQVPYCESETYVWLEPVKDDGIKLYFAVENPSGISAKALAAVLDICFSGKPAGEIAVISPDIVYSLFGKNIGMGKGQGLMAMVDMVRAKAAEIAARQNRQQGR